jgi:hypothetical protein
MHHSDSNFSPAAIERCRAQLKRQVGPRQHKGVWNHLVTDRSQRIGTWAPTLPSGVERGLMLWLQLHGAEVTVMDDAGSNWGYGIELSSGHVLVALAGQEVAMYTNGEWCE